MFEHSVKVPRHYKIAANIFKKVYTEGGSVKTLLYDDKLKHFRTNVLYALITETIKHAVDIEKIFETCGILANEPRLDPWLAKVLTAELLFGKKALPGKSKPEQTIISYKEQFEKCQPEQQDDTKTKAVCRPRYVRINTNLLATSDAIRAFQDEGYKFIRCTAGSYDDYLQQIQGLTEYDFTQDYHVKTMFVFAPGTKMHEHDLYLENQIILQDKATALAVHLLAPPPGSVALDMCAAPGMKTTQLAAFMRNQGKIYAVERNEERYKTLCEFVEKTGSKCVETLHKDSLEIKRGDCADVEYILLDPSCSGSGMDLHVHNYIEETRLARLTSLQEKFLKHAMNSFPNAKRIVYSTCSLFPEENERVITNVVKTSRAKWRVQDVKELLKGQWNNFGSGMYGSMGTRCLYALSNSDLTTGFFLAVLDRDPKDEKSHQERNVDAESCETKTNISSKNTTDEVNEDVGDTFDSKNGSKVKQKLKKNKKEHPNNNIILTEESSSTVINKEANVNIHSTDKDFDEDEEIETENIKQKHKKNKKKDTENNTEELCKVQIENNDEVTKTNKKRKIKDESTTDLATEEYIENISTLDINDISHSEVKKKKKKRKTEISQNEENDIQNESNTIVFDDNANESPVDVDNEKSKKSKKKKKKKDITGDSSGNSDSIDINEIIDDIFTRPKKRKKNKEYSGQSLEEAVTDDITIKKKKSEHTKNLDIENELLTEKVSKKKKKSKDL